MSGAARADGPCNIAAALPRLAGQFPGRIAMRWPGGGGPDGRGG